MFIFVKSFLVSYNALYCAIYISKADKIMETFI